MTRLLALFAAAVAFAVTACERHPLPGQSAVTFTHGSGGTEPAEGHEAGTSHEGAPKHEAAAKAEEKKAPGASEEAPKFFPEKK